MCYLITTHSLHCDARPVISDGHQPIINGHAPPTPCPCAPSPKIPSYLRCPDHGCCRISTRFRQCANRYLCQTTNFHLYKKAHTSTALWIQAPALDAKFHADPEQKAPWETPQWRASMADLLESGRLIARSQTLAARTRVLRQVAEAEAVRSRGVRSGEWLRARNLAKLREAEAEQASKLPWLMSQFQISARAVSSGVFGAGHVVSGLEMSKRERPCEKHGAHGRVVLKLMAPVRGRGRQRRLRLGSTIWEATEEE